MPVAEVKLLKWILLNILLYKIVDFDILRNVLCLAGWIQLSLYSIQPVCAQRNCACVHAVFLIRVDVYVCWWKDNIWCYHTCWQWLVDVLCSLTQYSDKPGLLRIKCFCRAIAVLGKDVITGVITCNCRAGLWVRGVGVRVKCSVSEVLSGWSVGCGVWERSNNLHFIHVWLLGI